MINLNFHISLHLGLWYMSWTYTAAFYRLPGTCLSPKRSFQLTRSFEDDSYLHIQALKSFIPLEVLSTYNLQHHIVQIFKSSGRKRKGKCIYLDVYIYIDIPPPTLLSGGFSLCMRAFPFSSLRFQSTFRIVTNSKITQAKELKLPVPIWFTLTCFCADNTIHRQRQRKLLKLIQQQSKRFALICTNTRRNHKVPVDKERTPGLWRNLVSWKSRVTYSKNQHHTENAKEQQLFNELL